MKHGLRVPVPASPVPAAWPRRAARRLCRGCHQGDAVLHRLSLLSVAQRPPGTGRGWRFISFMVSKRHLLWTSVQGPRIAVILPVTTSPRVPAAERAASEGRRTPEPRGVPPRVGSAKAPSQLRRPGVPSRLVLREQRPSAGQAHRPLGSAPLQLEKSGVPRTGARKACRSRSYALLEAVLRAWRGHLPATSLWPRPSGV